MFRGGCLAVFGGPEIRYAAFMTHPRIARDPAIMMGKPCIRGTRITVELILEHLSEGMSVAEFLQGYEHLTEDDVLAALRYAADYISNESLIAAE